MPQLGLYTPNILLFCNVCIPIQNTVTQRNRSVLTLFLLMTTEQWHLRSLRRYYVEYQNHSIGLVCMIKQIAFE